MTFDEYINNPMGQKNSVFSHREMYREMYTTKLNNILVREVGKVNYTLYTDGDRYYIYFKIPSEVVPKFYYDVVIEFIPKLLTKADNDLRKYDVRFYSNDPSFCFTFAYAFHKNKMFIDFLKDKMPKDMINKPAKERNPRSEVGYVKSLYFAYLLVQKYNLLKKINYSTYATKLNKKELASLIMNAQEKINLRQEMGAEFNKKQRKQSQPKVEKDNMPRIRTNSSNDTGSNTRVKNTLVTKTAKVAKTTKKANKR